MRGTPTANERQQIKRYPTPDLRDIVFYEYRDVTLPKNQSAQYGVSTPTQGSWPHHKLALIAPANEKGLEKWVYVADRVDQDLYNWEFDQADIGGTKFDSVKRTYLTPRSEFDENAHPNGSVMPDVPTGQFEGEWILAIRQQVRTGEEELDSLYVAEVHQYVRRSPFSKVVIDLQTGRSKYSVTTLHYRTEDLSGAPVETLAVDPSDPYWGLQSDGTFRELDQLSEDWFAITISSATPEDSVNSTDNPARARVIERVTPAGTDLIFSEKGRMPTPVPEYGSSHYDTVNFPNHVLSLIAPADQTGQLYEFFYVSTRANEDEYNWSHSKADIGGTKFDAVTRTYVTLRSAYTPDAPAMGATMPNIPSGKFSGTHVLAEKSQQRTGEQRIDNLFVIETRTYVKKVTLGAVEYDQATGRAQVSSLTLYYSGEILSGADTVDTLYASPANAYWGLQSDGTFRTITRQTASWYAVETKSVIPVSCVNTTANPAKTRIINRVTPLGTDVYFTEIGAMPTPVPSYGSAHYDAANWPNHKLSLITPEGASGLLFKFHYVANRSNQNDYNYEIMGGEQLIRTYIIPRADYLEYSYAQWVSAGSNASKWSYPPAGVDGTGSVGTRTRSLDDVFTKYAFIDDTLRRVSEEFDSLYVTIQRRYVEPVTVEYTYDETFERSVSITKELIAPATTAPTQVVGATVEIKKGNVFHDVRITQALIRNLPADNYPYALSPGASTQDHNFPSRLDSVELWWATAWASNTNQGESYDENFFFKFHVTDRRPGPYDATIHRYITDNPLDIKTLHPITYVPQPIAESIGITAAWFYAGDNGVRTSATAREWPVPGTIHDSITIPRNGDTAQKSVFYMTQELDETTGFTAFVALTEAVIDYRTRQLPMGLYEVSAVEIDITNLYGGAYTPPSFVEVDLIDFTLSAGSTPSTEVDINWTPGSASLNMLIYRATSAGGTYALVANVGADVGTYTNTGLTTGTAYFYKVRTGSISGITQYSDVQSIITA